MMDSLSEAKRAYPEGFPVKALEQHVAIVGKTGSGKTYAAKTLVEPMLAEGRRVCILDPTGAWYGLRSSADGKSAGYPVVVFGGDYGDVPINKGAGAGAALAEIIGAGNICAVVDLSEMLIGERHWFVTEFAKKLYSANNRRTLHLIIDEADEFAPQNPMPETKRMMHQIDRIVRRGRIRGFRVMLITQRPAVLHKNVLTQANTLIAMRLTAPQDRKALMEWVKGQADEKEGKALIDGLPTLKPGEGWIWAPEFGVLERRKFPRIRTLDTSKAPTMDDVPHDAVTLATVDVEAIEAQLGDIIAEAAANDPKVLKRRISELEREAAMPAPPSIPAPTRQEIDAAFARGRADGLASAAIAMHGLDPMLQEADMLLKQTQDKLAQIGRAGMIAADGLGAEAAKAPPMPQTAGPGRARRLAQTEVKLRAGNSSLPKGERAILIAVAQHPDGCTRTQTSILTGYKRSSRDAYIQRLSEKGYVEKTQARITVTPQGIDALGADYEPLPTGPALFEWWKDRLPDGERRVLEIVAGKWPHPIPRSAIREATDYARSSCDAYVQRLKARELVTADSDGVKAADLIF